MIDLKHLKRKPAQDEYIGARVSSETKEALDKFSRIEGITASALIAHLVELALQSKGYLK
jgi:hypothetical protein